MNELTLHELINLLVVIIQATIISNSLKHYREKHLTSKVENNFLFAQTTPGGFSGRPNSKRYTFSLGCFSPLRSTHKFLHFSPFHTWLYRNQSDTFWKIYIYVVRLGLYFIYSFIYLFLLRRFCFGFIVPFITLDWILCSCIPEVE